MDLRACHIESKEAVHVSQALKPCIWGEEEAREVTEERDSGTRAGDLKEVIRESDGLCGSKVQKT